MGRSSVVTLGLAFLTGCLTARPAAQGVRITTNAEVVRGCTFLGNVRANSGWTGGLGQRNVEETLKDRAHDMGGDTIMIATSNYDSGSQAIISQATAEVYLCTTPTTAPR